MTFKKGHIVTKETREKQSKSHSGEKNYWYGKHLTEKHKKKLRLANKNQIPWNKGKKGLRHHTDAAKMKMRLSHIGQHSGMKGKHHTKKSIEKMRLAHMGFESPNKGVHLKEETKIKISESLQGNVPWNKGKTDVYSKKALEKMSLSHKGKTTWNKGIPMKDKQKKKISIAKTGVKRETFTEETRQKLRINAIKQFKNGMPEGTRRKISGSNKGKVRSEEAKINISNAQIDWDFYNKHGCFKQYYPYNNCFTKEFKDMIRARDGNKCVVTGMTSEEHKAKYGVSLFVHHWTYDKDVTNPFYFVTVTRAINFAAETNRGEWIGMFNGIMEDTYCEMLQIND